MSTVVFFPMLLLVALTSLYVTAALRLPAYAQKVAAFFLISYAQFVLVGEWAGLLGHITIWFVVLIHLVIFFAAVVVLLRYRKIGLREMVREFEPRSIGVQARAIMSQQPDLAVLTICVTLAYLILAYINVLVPPNNVDSMTAHMSRVGYWLQHQSLRSWPNTQNPFQITYPINAQISILWTVLFSGSDRYAAFVQYGGALLGFVSIYGIAKNLGASTSQSLYAALLWGTFTEVILQSTSTQNDLIASAFTASAFLFFYSGIRQSERGSLVLSALALALAVGTKQTVLFILPGILVLSALFAYADVNHARRKVFFWAVTLLLMLLFFGSYGYLKSYSEYGSFFGPPDAVSAQLSRSSELSAADQYVINSSRFLYQSIDFSGLPTFIALRLQTSKDFLFGVLCHTLGVDITDPRASFQGIRFQFSVPARIQEDFSWFGPVSILVLLPAIVRGIFLSFRRGGIYVLGLLLVSFIMIFITTAFLWGWTPHYGRYFVLVATLCSPLVAMMYGEHPRHKFVRWSLVFIALLVTFNTTVRNEAKPLIGPRAIWHLDRAEKQSLNRWLMNTEIKMVEQLIPDSATLGTLLTLNDWDYPLFGKHFSRKIEMIDKIERCEEKGWLQRRGISFILANNHFAPQLDKLSNLTRIAASYDWSVYVRGSNDMSDWDADVRGRISDLSRCGNVRIDSDLVGKIGVTAFVPPEWGGEVGQKSFWIGNSRGQGVSFTLFSDTSRPIALSFDVASGPSRNDSRRRVQLTLSNRDTSLLMMREFDKASTIEFDCRLLRGRNDFTFYSLDQPTIRVLPNGDPRPLLLSLGEITVTSLLGSLVAGPAGFPILDISPTYGGILGISSNLHLPPWNFDQRQGASVLWLGSGRAKGIGGTIRSLEQVRARFILDVVAGPARKDLARTIEMTTRNARESRSQRKSFNQNGLLSFSVTFLPGDNAFLFSVVEKATIERQPNGDTRDVLVLLKHIRVERQ